LPRPSTAEPRHSDGVHDRSEPRGITGLSGRDQQTQQPAPQLRRHVNLGAQSAPRRAKPC
jgi:hypothetical protein